MCFLRFQESRGIFVSSSASAFVPSDSLPFKIEPIPPTGPETMGMVENHSTVHFSLTDSHPMAVFGRGFLLAEIDQSNSSAGELCVLNFRLSFSF